MNNKHGNDAHPDLPLCVNCTGGEYNTLHCFFAFGLISLQYVCRNCGTEAVFRSHGAPGILLWITNPQDKLVYDRLDMFLIETDERRDSEVGIIRDMPPIPPGLQAHLLNKDGVWEKLICG